MVHHFTILIKVIKLIKIYTGENEVKKCNLKIDLLFELLVFWSFISQAPKAYPLGTWDLLYGIAGISRGSAAALFTFLYENFLQPSPNAIILSLNVSHHVLQKTHFHSSLP